MIFFNQKLLDAHLPRYRTKSDFRVQIRQLGNAVGHRLLSKSLAHGHRANKVMPVISALALSGAR